MAAQPLLRSPSIGDLDAWCWPGPSAAGNNAQGGAGGASFYAPSP